MRDDQEIIFCPEGQKMRLSARSPHCLFVEFGDGEIIGQGDAKQTTWLTFGLFLGIEKLFNNR
jgi:hypothetical protein